MSSDQKRAFLAVALSGLVLVLWSVFFSPEKSSVQKRQGRKVEEGPPPLSLPLSLPPQPSAGQQVTLSSSGHEITLDSNLSIVDFHNPNERFTFKQTLGEKSQVSFLLKDSQGKRVFPSFELTEVKETSFRGKDENLGLEVLGEMDELGRVFLSLLSKNLTRFSLLVNTWPKEVEGGRTRELISYAEKVERLDLEEKEPLQGQFSWVGVDFNYHLFGMLFGAEGTKVFASIERTSKGPFFVDLVHPVNKLDVTLVYTKKSYNYLKSLGKSLQQSVDFGFFGVLAIYILRGLQFIYQYFPNYGVAIIILTFLIRLLLFPLQYKSIKSMKKMQVIQPEMNKIREKYKEHPQELQKRTMELFKRSGANPLGGCFPFFFKCQYFLPSIRFSTTP